jgi:serine/threonine-protein kinase
MLLPSPPAGGSLLTELLDRLTAALADQYRLDRELGRGGMATVFLAYDLRHKRPVALKVLHPELAHTLGPERFQREIETAARLQHPHILTVHDSGESAGQLWYTMPYVEGESLRDRLRRERQLPLAEALQITLEVADALGYAHRHGVVHRDIKPENILLSEGHALVADFGVARALQSAGGEQLTETGSAVGTPAYMSPEQSMADRSLDGRSDLYSLGCVLYEMLTGEAPYTGPSAQAVIAKRLLDPVPSARRLRETVPAGVDEALQRVLAKAPADRFAAAAEFARALQPSDATPTATPTVPSPSAAWAGRRSSVGPDGTYRRRMPVVTMALGLGFLIGLGVLFAWRRSHPRPEETGGAKVLAVLPFENLGDSSQAYFADGVGDEVRGKLSQLAGLAVIARASSNEYRRTTKPPQQIARELGAEYLLTATVRWDKHQDGTSRVRVSPELVRVKPGAAPTTKWQQGFDAALTDVFQVQANIAGQVAQALNVALGDSVKRELAAKPTQSLPAYDAFLRGEAALRIREQTQEGTLAMAGESPGSYGRAIAAYEQAVALDSTFVEAWAGLAQAQLGLYQVNPTRAAGEAGRRAAERALAIAPTRPEGHLALSKYYYVVAWDDPRGFAEDSIALAVAPTDARALSAMGWDELYLGRWDEGRRHFEQALRLDPRSIGPAAGLARVLLYTRHYPEAAQAYNRMLEQTPTSLDKRELRAMVALAQGDLAGAQAIIKAAPKEVDPTALVAYVGTSEDLVWVLDHGQQELLLRLRPSAFDDNLGTWGLVLAQTYAYRDDTMKARTYADSARIAFEQQLQASPQDPTLHVYLGLSLAYLGHKAKAIREGERGTGLMPMSRDAILAAYLQHQLARIYLLVGEPEKALDYLEPLLKIPYYLSPGWLKIDPNFAPLRGNPRFERLVKGS